MAERKVVQIAAAFDGGDGSYQPGVEVVALCNDGTVWSIYQAGSERRWCQMPPIPQDESPTPDRTREQEGGAS